MAQCFSSYFPPPSLRASQSTSWNFQVPLFTTIFKTVMERSGKIPFLTWILHFLATTSCTVTPMQNAIQGLSTQYSGLTILNLHNSRKFLLLLGHLLPTLLYYRNLFQAHIMFALVLSKVSKGHGNCWNTCWRTKNTCCPPTPREDAIWMLMLYQIAAAYCVISCHMSYIVVPAREARCMTRYRYSTWSFFSR